MFPDSLALNLLVFLLAQATVWGYLRTGLVRRGVLVLVGSWVLGDVALLARFAFGEVGSLYQGALFGLWALTLVEAGRFGWGRWRRRRPEAREQRHAEFQRGTRLWMSDEIEAADGIFAGLVRRDPWDLRARLALAQLRVAQDRPANARRLLQAARHLDRRRHFDDLIRYELSRCGVKDAFEEEGDE